jgi:hypothetical protein
MWAAIPLRAVLYVANVNTLANAHFAASFTFALLVRLEQR